MILALCLVYEMNVMQPKKVGPILPFAAPHYFDRCWGKAEMTMAQPERRGKLRGLVLGRPAGDFAGAGPGIWWQRKRCPQFGGVRLPQSGAADCRFGQR